jgi:sensor histidine kinase YesM
MKLVPFSQELEHIRHYLALEKLRFGDSLKVCYDIREESFGIPLLSVQPLVENAVKHGILKKREGGTIRIASKREGNCYRITVTDDGIGFDADECMGDGKRHIGIDNVQRRLEMESGARLSITSRAGCGTTAVITIPAGRGRLL